MTQEEKSNCRSQLMGAGGRPQTSRHNSSRGIHHPYLSRPLWRLSYQNSRSKETPAILPEVHITGRVRARQQHSERRDPSISASPRFDLLPTFILTNDYQRNTPYMDLKVSEGSGEAGMNPCLGREATSTSCTLLPEFSSVLAAPSGALPTGNERTR